MSVPILEAFADAIMYHEGWQPWSRSYRNRNPGNLRPVNGTEPHDDGNYRVFPSLVDGYQALLGDLHAKFTGHSVTGLGPDSTLLQMFELYAPINDNNQPVAYAESVAGWLHSVYGQQFNVSDTLLHIVTAVGQEALIYGVVADGHTS